MYNVSTQEGNCGLVWNHLDSKLQSTVLVLLCVLFTNIASQVSGGIQLGQEPRLQGKASCFSGVRAIPDQQVEEKGQLLASLLKEEQRPEKYQLL